MDPDLQLDIITELSDLVNTTLGVTLGVRTAQHQQSIFISR